MKFLSLFLAILAIFPACHSYNILVLIAFPGPSHHVYIGQFVKELINRGHHVTSIVNFPLLKVPSSNYTEIFIEPIYDLGQHMGGESIFQQTESNDFEYIYRISNMGRLSSEHGLQTKNVKKFIERTDIHFDLIIAEQFYQESWLMFAHKFNAPIVTLGTLGYADFMDRFMGLQTPWSHVSHVFINYSDDMTFSQRFYNTILSMFDLLYRKFIYLPENDRQAKEYFKSLEKNGPLPSIQQLEKSISVVFSNTHNSLSPPRPKMPGMIDIAGAHVRPPKPLPNDIQKFLDDATDGAIYFSLGAFVRSSDMPKEKVNAFLESFKKLKQRVLWKWEDENLPNLPENVMVRKWMPQSDILAHKNVRLFISHGGMFGTIEGLYRGLPMLFIPLYGDQHRNALKAVARGYAIKMDFPQINSETLSENLNQLLNNKQYYIKAKETSALLKDNPIDPMEEFLYWTEFVIRHKGAKFLKSAAVNQCLTSYLLLDILAVIVIGFLLLAAIFYNLLHTVIGGKKVADNQNVNSKKSDKKKKVKKQ